MNDNSTVSSINVRYSKLAETSCCLSCGGAVHHAEPRAGETCLDLGSGRGNDVLRMADQVGSEGKAYGLDISDGMLGKARRQADKLGVTNAEFLQSELEIIPLEDKSLDLVISNCTINHAKDKQAVWNEVFRCLKTGGRFVVSDIYAMQTVPAEYANDPDAVAECWAGAVTKDEYFRQLENAGFKDVEVLEESEPYEKGAVTVASITLAGRRPGGCCK